MDEDIIKEILAGLAFCDTISECGSCARNRRRRCDWRRNRWLNVKEWNEAIKRYRMVREL